MRRVRRFGFLTFGFTGLLSAVAVFVLITGIGIGLALGTETKPVVNQPIDPPAMSAEDRAERFQPGPVWEGTGPQGISQQEAEAFADYPLFWLGESFAGYNLRAIHREQFTPPAGVPSIYATDSVSFSYGDCTIPEGYSACPIPLVVSIEPVCKVRPEMVADSAREGAVETVRGGARQLRFRDGHLKLWSGPVSITVDAPADPALVDQMVQQLRGIGVSRAVRAGASLPAPDFAGCPPVDVPPLGSPPMGG